MEFRPCIDIHEGKVKQIVGSSLTIEGNASENFVSEYSAKYYALMFKKDNLKGGHICMLGSGNEAEAELALRAYPNAMQIGGGINADNAQKFINMGASHIIVTSYIFNDGKISYENIEKLSKSVPKKNIVFDLSCRIGENGKDYYVATDRWTKLSNYKVNKEALEELSQYCDEFLIHSTNVEGKKAGIDEELIKILAEYEGANPITYAGGIASYEDIKRIKELGKGKINFTIGTSLDIFGGKLSYDKIVDMIK